MSNLNWGFLKKLCTHKTSTLNFLIFLAYSGGLLPNFYAALTIFLPLSEAATLSPSHTSTTETKTDAPDFRPNMFSSMQRSGQKRLHSSTLDHLGRISWDFVDYCHHWKAWTEKNDGFGIYLAHNCPLFPVQLLK